MHVILLLLPRSLKFIRSFHKEPLVALLQTTSDLFNKKRASTSYMLLYRVSNNFIPMFLSSKMDKTWFLLYLCVHNFFLCLRDHWPDQLVICSQWKHPEGFLMFSGGSRKGAEGTTGLKYMWCFAWFGAIYTI